DGALHVGAPGQPARADLDLVAAIAGAEGAVAHHRDAAARGREVLRRFGLRRARARIRLGPGEAALHGRAAAGAAGAPASTGRGGCEGKRERGGLEEADEEGAAKRSG